MKKTYLLNVFLCAFSLAGISRNVLANSEKSNNLTPALKQRAWSNEMDGTLGDSELPNEPFTEPVNNTIYLTNNYASYYFKNLTNNYGYNKYDSCGYISTAMILSFWDTYWDDNVIEEKYDKVTDVPFSHASLDVESPGIKKEPESLYEVGTDQYRANIRNYKNTYLHYYLINRGCDLFGAEAEEGGHYFMNWGWYSTLVSDYLYNYRGYSTSEVEIIEETGTGAKETAIDLIKQGIPVKLSLGGSFLRFGGHAVVGYDYNERTKEIYCHAGWGPNLTHVTIEQMSYTSINHMYAIKFNNAHSHTNNFKHVGNGTTTYHCACETVIPYDIQEENYYLDAFPTFKWNCLINERWYSNLDPHLEFEILRHNMSTEYSAGVIYRNEFTLDKYAAKALMSPNNTVTNYFYVRVSTFSSRDSSFNGRFYYFRTVYKPIQYLDNGHKYLSITSVSKSGNNWKVTIKNNTIYNITTGEYNSKLCFDSDAKNWTKLYDKKSLTIMPLDTKTVTISTNFFADTVALSYEMNGSRYITYAKNLKSNGSFSQYTSLK